MVRRDVLIRATIRPLPVPVCLAVPVNDVVLCPGDGQVRAGDDDRVEVAVWRVTECLVLLASSRHKKSSRRREMVGVPSSPQRSPLPRSADPEGQLCWRAVRTRPRA
jgi:hypothetical protein